MPRSRKRVEMEGSDESDQYDDEISTFHKERDKILLDDDDDFEAASEAEEEEEVYGLVDDASSSDDDEDIKSLKQQLRQFRRNKFKQKMGSDLEEEEEEEEEVPAAKGWGAKKSMYYGGDVRGKGINVSGSEDEAGTAALELKEGLALEKNYTAFMTDEDFMMEPAHVGEKKTTKKKGKKENLLETDVNRISTDFSKLSKKEAISALKKLHPEYIPLVTDLHAKAREMVDRILPLMRLVKEGAISDLSAEYVKMKYHIITNYLSNGAFYMHLVNQKTPQVQDHPVIVRLNQFRQLYERLVPVDKAHKAEVDALLEKVKRGEDLSQLKEPLTSPADQRKKSRPHKLHTSSAEKKKRKPVFSFEEDKDAGENNTIVKKAKTTSERREAEADEEERRGITYQMERNQGILQKKNLKKKELRNPRVKHRTKFRKAKIRRKGQVRDYKPPKQAYSGELTGIRTGIIRSRKL